MPQVYVFPMQITEAILWLQYNYVFLHLWNIMSLAGSSRVKCSWKQGGEHGYILKQMPCADQRLQGRLEFTDVHAIRSKRICLLRSMGLTDELQWKWYLRGLVIILQELYEDYTEKRKLKDFGNFKTKQTITYTNVVFVFTCSCLQLPTSTHWWKLYYLQSFTLSTIQK